MKKFISRIRKFENWAALLMAGAAFVACSGSDDIIVNEQQPVNPATQKYTMTIKATKSSDATTRGLLLNGSTLNVKWNANEEVQVYQAQGGVDVHLGTLYATFADTPEANGNVETTLTGTLNVAPTTDNSIYFYLHAKNQDYSGQNGVLLASVNSTKSIENNYDYAKTYVTTDKFSINDYKVIVDNSITLESQQAIVKFSLVEDNGSGGTQPLSATSLTVEDIAYNLSGGTSFISGAPLNVDHGSATNEFYVAIANLNDATKHSDLVLTAITASGDTYTYTKKYSAGKPVYFEHGKYYAITVKMKKTFKTFRVGDVINVGNQIAVTNQWSVNNGSWFFNVGNILTLVRANIIVDGNTKTITEAADGAYYVVKLPTDDPEHPFYYFDDQTMPVTETSDGLVVTSVDLSGSNPRCTLAVNVKKADATVTAPTPVTATLFYSGNYKTLFNEGSTTGGTLMYKVTTTSDKPTDKSDFKTTIDQGTDAGTYYLWYYLDGGDSYNSTEVNSEQITKTIQKASWYGGVEVVYNNESQNPHYLARYQGYGKIIKWEYSTNSGNTWTTWSGTSVTTEWISGASYWRVTLAGDNNHDQTVIEGHFN